MAASYDPSARASGSGLSRRPAPSSKPRPPSAPPLHADIDPPPRPRAGLQYVALGVIVILGCLQFLPATHFRDPADPLRNWIPINPNVSKPISTDPRADVVTTGGLNIFSLMECLDLRVLAVLANSTLSNSRHPERIFFHFFVPESEDEKASYYKLKARLPYANIRVIGLKKAKEKFVTPTSNAELLQPLLPRIVPFLIPRVNLSVDKFIYVSPNTIIKGNVEDIFGVDLGTHAIAAAEDCSKRLGDYVNIDVINTIQRMAVKPWVSDKPYDKDACLPDLNLVLLDARKLENNLVDAIFWWSKVLNLGTTDSHSSRGSQVSPAAMLAIYGKYRDLPVSWSFRASTSTGSENECNVLPFDGPMKICSKDNDQLQTSSHGNVWNEYITPNSD